VRALLLALTFLALAAAPALAQSAPSQAPGSPFGPLPQPAPTPPPTQTQTQTQAPSNDNTSSSDSGPSKGVLALLFVAAIVALAAAGFFISRDARRTVKPKQRAAKRARPRAAQPSGARAPGAPPPPPRKARRARKR